MEKRFVRLPADSVSLCAESLGIQTPQEVASGLVEDVSFRIRQITDTASQFMRHSKRRKMIVDDFNRAMKWSGVEPLYGHSTTEPPAFNSIHASGLYSVNDSDVKLSDIAFGPSPHSSTLPKPPSVKATWLAIEGTSLPSTGSEDSNEASVELKRTSQEVSISGPTVEITLHTFPLLLQSHHKYLSLLLEAVTGDNEDMRRIALSDIQTNTSVANILPDLVQYMVYLYDMVTPWVQHSPLQTMQMLRLLLAVFRNTSLFLPPYVHSLFPLVKSIILTATYLHAREDLEHWQVRQMAALCIAEIVRRCESPLGEFVPELHLAFRQVLSAHEVSLPLLYGVVLTLCYLGGESIAEVLFPQLDAVNSYVQTLLQSSEPYLRDSALRVYDTLLLAAELLLTSGAVQDVDLPSSDTRPFDPLYQPPPFDGGIFAPPPTDIASDMADLGMHKQTLYEYLVDMFGERLNLRLTGHTSSLSPPSSSKRDEPNTKPFSTAPPPKDDVLLRFLAREGFKPAHSPAHPPAPTTTLRHRGPGMLFGGREPFRIAVQWRGMPVCGNVLDMNSTTPKHKRRGIVPVAEKGTSPTLKMSSRRRIEVPTVNTAWL